MLASIPGIPHGIAMHPQTKEFIDEMMRACARHGEKVIDKNYMNAVFNYAFVKVGFCNK